MTDTIMHSKMVAINLFAILKYTLSFNEEDETMII